MIRTAEPVAPAPARLRVAVGVALLGSLLTATGPVVGVVDDSAPPAFTAWPLLAVLALVPVAVAAAFVVRQRPVAAAAALIAPAVFAVGRLLNDLQIVVDPLYAARPELFRPASLDALTPTAGMWLLLAGHVLVLAAGAMAVATLGGGEPDVERPGFVLPATAGVIAGIGLFTKPFTSTDALIPANGPFESPALPMAGGLLLTIAVPVLAVLAASATTPDTRRGGLLGLAAVLVASAVQPIATALATDRVDLTVGPFLVLVAAVAIAWPHRAVTEQHDPELPGLRRLHVIAGVLGLAAGLSAAAGALTDHLVLPLGLPAPDYAARLLWPAAIATTALAAALLAKAPVRPAFTVVTATVPMAAAGALDAVFAATRVNAVEAGLGVWFTALAVVAAVAAAVTAAVAGAVERDEVGTPKTEPPLPLIAATLIAALLAFGAFGLPVLRAQDFVPIGAFGGRVGSWGLLVALIAVVAAAVIALKARPNQGAALLLGAALVSGVRVLEYPLTAGRAVEAAPGPGLWLAVATTAALLIAAALRTAR